MATAYSSRLARPPAAVIAIPLAAAVCGLGLLHLVAPAYLSHQGFPLDDAWIHAVYARELARSGMLAYNPGIPATGETSPLWAAVLAVPHWLAGADAAVRAAKLTGFGLHAFSALVIALAVAAAAGRPTGIMAGTLAALHPDLLAAAVSGMEVPLATLAISLVSYACVQERPVLLSVAGAVAFLSRPETAVVAALCPFLYFVHERPARWSQMTAAALAGSAAALAATAVRNLVVSGLPLPATFYAKAAASGRFALEWQHVGFTRVLEAMPVVGLPALTVAVLLAAVWLLRRHDAPASARLGSALAISGLAFCAVSFALVHPLDPKAFYHQRYALPAVLPMVAALPLLINEATARVPAAGVVRAALIAILVGWMVAAAPVRFRRLSNDARNVDDVQVAFGRALSHASKSDVAWVVDAGASRYFGAAFVVDLMALNTHELLGSNGERFLERHPPRYLDAFDGWSTVKMADADGVSVRTFSVSTPYTVTSFPNMSRHHLIACEPAGRRGTIAVKSRTFSFVCASASSQQKPL